MANIATSRRGTALDRIITDAAFRLGFNDARAGKSFAGSYEDRSTNWQWHYEWGRLFAVGAGSRWKRIPRERRDVTRALKQSLHRAFYQGGVIPRAVKEEDLP